MNAQVEPDSLILIDSFSIYYDSDAYELGVEDEKKLADFFDYQNTTELEFHIDSFTDIDGDEEYNLQLSGRRSAAIVEWLQFLGLEDHQITHVGHGEKYALATNKSSGEKSRDRKSVVKVYQRAAYKLFAGVLASGESEELEEVEISVFDSGIKRRIAIESGSAFSIPIPVDRPVVLQFEAKNHFPTVRRLKLSPRSKVNHLKMPLIKMDVGATASLHLQFVGNKSIVLPAYRESLVTLASVLKKSPNICLELAGHIHQPGARIDDPQHQSYGLSKARSLEVYNYLTEHGIEAKRLLARGYSNHQMKYPSATTEREMSANRRVEAIVMPCDSTRLIENHSVADLSFYKVVQPMEKKYRRLWIEKDLEMMNPNIISQITDQARFDKMKGRDLNQSTYQALMIRYIRRKLAFRDVGVKKRGSRL